MDCIQEDVAITTNTQQAIQDPQEEKKMSEIVFDFLFEPKYGSMFSVLLKKLPN